MTLFETVKSLHEAWKQAEEPHVGDDVDWTEAHRIALQLDAILALHPPASDDAIAAKCSAGPDHADIVETIENAADDWQQQGYSSALAEVRDMANVGRALMEALPEGYHYNDCPSEIVSDLQNERDDAIAAKDAEIAAAERRGEQRAIARVVNVSRTIGFQAGVGGRETAGAIVSYLATSPDEIALFVAGALSPLDFAGDWMRGGCLTWHATNGKVVDPATLTEPQP